MKSMSPKKLAWWEKQRAKGKWPWILRMAAFWGTSMILLMYLFALLVHEDKTFYWFSVPLYLIGGVLVGWLSWIGNEGQYQWELLEKKMPEDSE